MSESEIMQGPKFREKPREADANVLISSERDAEIRDIASRERYSRKRELERERAREREGKRLCATYN